MLSVFYIKSNFSKLFLKLAILEVHIRVTCLNYCIWTVKVRIFREPNLAYLNQNKNIILILFVIKKNENP